MGEYYDGTKLLSLKDQNRKTPEVYICTTNRNGGKTTFFNRWRINAWKKRKEKTIWYFRYQTELENAAESIFKSQKELFFPGLSYTQQLRLKGKYADLFLNGCHMGYAIALNSADGIKKYSSLFYDANWIIFDEFQPETNQYCPNEITKFLSLHTSLARGGGLQVRYLPIVMISNAVTLLNPYYTAMGISSRLRSKDHFVRGNGYVMEQGYISTASARARESAFNQAFAGHSYLDYAAQNTYLLDNQDMIKDYTGPKSYLATVYDEIALSVQFIQSHSTVYFCKQVDYDFPLAISTRPEYMKDGVIHKKSNPVLIKTLRQYFDLGRCRFDSLESKQACFNLLSF